MNHLLSNDPMKAIMVGGASMAVAAVVTMRVNDVDEPRG
jgi:hypothetical protein